MTLEEQYLLLNFSSTSVSTYLVFFICFSCLADDFPLRLLVVGLAVAYWLEFGLKYTSGRSEQFAWRFPLAFQIVFLLIIMFSISLFPESPRWLAKMGREDEARHVLAVCRTPDADEDNLEVSAELYEVSAYSACSVAYVTLVDRFVYLFICFFTRHPGRSWKLQRSRGTIHISTTIGPCSSARTAITSRGFVSVQTLYYLPAHFRTHLMSPFRI